MKERIKPTYEREMTTELEEVIEPIEEAPAEEESHGPQTKNGTIVDALFVKVRKKPSMDSDVLEILEEGKKVTILGKVEDFYKVSTSSNSVAYIFSKFVKED